MDASATMSHAGQQRSPGYGGIAALLAIIGFATGCGGGGSGSSTTSGAPGAVSMAITDVAHTDIAVFTVCVTSIRLETANGAQVDTLPAIATVNVADLSSLSELLSTAIVPQGVYTGARIGLDLTGAQTVVALTNGNSTANGRVVLRDASGARAGLMSARMVFDAGHPLTVGPSIAAHVLLDFDLDQSLDVDTSVVPNVVTLRPVISGDGDHLRPRLTRIRGLLGSVNLAASIVHVVVRPLTPGEFGVISIATDASTAFSGDDFDNGTEGSSPSGGCVGLPPASGDDPDNDGDTRRSLNDVAAAPPGTPVDVLGNYSTTDGMFHALTMQYGHGLPGGGSDVAEGLVVDVSGSSYTLGSALVSPVGGEVTHNTTVTLTIDAHTIIRSIGVSGLLTSGNIGVGQHLLASGILSGTSPAFGLDCTSASPGTTGTAQLEPTEIIGNVLAATTSSVTLSVDAIGRRPATQFNFAGAGIDPSNFGVTISGTLPIAPSVGSFVLCLGFLTPLASSPFAAAQVAPFDNAQVLEVHWPAPGTNLPLTFPNGPVPVVSLLSDGSAIVASVAGPHVLSLGPSLVFGSSAAGAGIPKGPLSINQGGDVTQYAGDSALAWLIDLRARLAQGSQVRALTAVGRYDVASNAFTAQSVTAIVETGE